MHGDSDVPRLAELRHVNVMRRVGASHVERRLRAIGAHHAEVGQKRFLPVEIGRAQPPVREIEGLDHWHGGLLRVSDDQDNC